MELFKHQGEGSAFLRERTGAILADEMGLGKSRQAIVALGAVSESLNVVVCPASLKLNWEREIKMVYPEDEVLIGYVPDAIGLGIRDPSWLVLNYDQIGKWRKALAGKRYSLVGDEAHYIKGRSQRTRHFLELARGAERVYLLTGTPILNRPIELYNMLKAIRHPLAFTKGTGADNWFGYAMRYCGAYRQKLRDGRSFLNVKGASNLAELKERISGSFLRRMKADVLDLPEKIVQTVPVELTDEEQVKYDRAFDEYIDFLRENPIEGKSIDNVLMARHLVEIQKLKQVCSEAKIATVMEDVASAVESGQKVVIFTQYRETMRVIAEACIPLVGKVFVFTLGGSDTVESRDSAVRGFQQAILPAVFVGNIKAAGIGITLTAATNVFFADLDWTPAVHDQAMDRCHRIGQTGTVNVRYYVAKSTIEEDIMSMLAEKRRVIAGVLSGEGSGEAEGVAQLVGRISGTCG